MATTLAILTAATMLPALPMRMTFSAHLLCTLHFTCDADYDLQTVHVVIHTHPHIHSTLYFTPLCYTFVRNILLRLFPEHAVLSLYLPHVTRVLNYATML